MHPSALRLYKAAESVTPPVKGQSAVARWLNVSPQNMTNWEKRGVSKAGAIKAQKLSGYNATWILEGTGERRVTEPALQSNIFEAPTLEELELLDNFRHMLDDDREELAAEIARRAAKAKENVDKYIQRLGLTPRPQTASAKAVGSTSRATVPPAQGSLDLEPKQRRVGAK